MVIDINKILGKNILKKLTSGDVTAINESINAEYNTRVNKLETDTSNRFETLVENLTEKFDNQVNQVIVEDFRDNVSKTVDTKLYSVIKSVANVLESAGIPVTEKTKELQSTMKDMEKKINDMTDEYEVMKDQYKDEKKENWIHRRLEGMKPEIISHALEYFKNKDILDVQDEIEAFLDNDFSSLVLDGDDDLSSDLDLDRVKDALQGLDETEGGRVNKDRPASKFESLGKGLKSQKVLAGRTPNNIDSASLVESSRTLTEGANPGDDDTREALNKIDDFNNLGYNFK